MKTVLIFRGLASGRRGTLINELMSKYTANEVIRIDTPQPELRLTKEQLKDLATHSFNQFKDEVTRGTRLILVNNANLKHYHYGNYVSYAQRNGYSVGIIIVPWNDLNNRELQIDSGGKISIDKFSAYRKIFEWGDFSLIKRPTPTNE